MIYHKTNQHPETVEVFKTNVIESHEASHLIGIMQTYFTDHTVNFDLDDCDKIMRVKSKSGVNVSALIGLLTNLGFMAEILADEIPANELCSDLKTVNQKIEV